MSRTANARVAGATLLVYIAAGIAPMVRAPGQLLGVVFSLVACLSALVLGVTLYAITSDEGHEIAMLGMVCRVAEGILGAMFIPARLALKSLGAAPEGLAALNTFLGSARSFNILLGATFFAVGSTMFSWLFLRGRMIPAPLAWLGVVASVLLVVGLPLQLGGVLGGPIAMAMWLPMLLFEVPLGVWLIVRGVQAERAAPRSPYDRLRTSGAPIQPLRD
jgi:hypothetical protein